MICLHLTDVQREYEVRRFTMNSNLHFRGPGGSDFSVDAHPLDGSAAVNVSATDPVTLVQSLYYSHWLEVRAFM